MEKHVHVIDNEKIDKIEIDKVLCYDLASIFKMFADSTRIQILECLLDNELNVCEISYLLEMTHSAISHQLSTLKLLNLVKSRKIGKEVYYSLKDDHVRTILDIGKEHLMEEK